MMKAVSLLFLLALVACEGAPGNDPVPEGSNQNQNADKSQWTVNSSSINFPEKFSLQINGNTVFSTCTDPNAAKVTQTGNNRVLVNFKYTYVPQEQDSVEVSIFDLSKYCNYYRSFYSEKYVEHTIVTTPSGKEITATLKN